MRAMTTLENSYCVPRTEEEFKSLHFYSGIEYKGSLPVITSEGDSYCYIAYFGTGDRTKISVFHFRDLLHDRIVPWRLEEVGFVKQGTHPHTYYSLDARDAFRFLVTTNGVWLNGECLPTISTFTKLLTLVQFLNLPANNA